MDRKKSKIGFEIKTLDNIINRKIMEISLKNGMDQITVMHGWIIGYLYANDGKDIYQKDLEKEFCISRSTVTNILKLMEKKGYVKRLAVEQDARLKKLVLTEQAKAIQKKNCLDVHDVMENQLSREIPEEEIEVFLKVIQKMKYNLEGTKK